ncbi:MAG TPA: energy-coupling factor transporter transmembrane component T [Thermoleophilaceae bacterium]|nr:energy-coupling factor transporter transmembrane component T [Thermoleophilaceae bacterium]
MSSFLTQTYRRRPTPLHSARAGAAAAYCMAFALVPALYQHPLMLLAAGGGIFVAAGLAGVSKQVRRATLIGLPIAIVIALVNPLVSQNGSTVVLRLGELFGHRFDVTSEAILFGLVAGLRVLVLIAAFGLFNAVVDPDELMRAVRRFSYRSALTASLATRLVPVLVRDATRMNDAARCRARPAPRTMVARAALASALDRAVDVAAALELRGYGSAVRPARVHRPWSRHDIRIAAAALVLAVVVVGMRILGVGEFEPYPSPTMTMGPADLVLALVLVSAGALPFVGARARLGVARG